MNNVTGEIIFIQNNDESFGVKKIRIQADKYIHRKLIRQKYKCKKKKKEIDRLSNNFKKRLKKINKLYISINTDR